MYIGRLLDFIGHIESTGNYLAFHNNPKNKTIKFTDMSINEVIEWQEDRDTWRKLGAKSSAVGKYQFMPQTLEYLKKRENLSGREKFGPATQDFLAKSLLERRGLSKFLLKQISDEEFMLNLSKEWASLPDPRTGCSYYDKDGLNKSLVSVKEFREALPRT